MKIVNEQRSKLFYFQDSTAASISSGSYSSANEDNLSFMIRNGVLIVDSFEAQTSDQEKYAAITKVERERIKNAYPKPGLAKLPAVGEEF